MIVGASGSKVLEIQDNDFRTPEITSVASPTNLASIPVNVDFGGEVNGFDLAGIVVTGGTATIPTDLGGGRFRFNVSPAADGMLTVAVASGAATDSGGKETRPSEEVMIFSDRTGPSPVVTGPIGPIRSTVFAVSVDFNEVVTSFAASDVDIDGGTIAAFVDNGNGKFTLSASVPIDGAVSIEIGPGVAEDAAGNANVASLTYTVVVDTESPMPQIAGPIGPVANKSFDVEVDFGEQVQQFVASDIVIGNGAVNALAEEGNGLYTATVEALSDGPVTVDVPAAVASDTAGNPNAEAQTFSVVVDSTPPIPSISGPIGSVGTGAFEVTIDFGETVEGFADTDLQVQNATIVSFLDEGNGKFITSIEPASDGIIRVDVPDEVATDVAGNLNSGSLYSVSVDSQAPEPEITGPDGPTNVDPFEITVDFGESVEGFDEADVIVDNGAVVAVLDDGNGRYSVTVDAVADGLVIIDVLADAAADVAGNPSTQATTLSVTVDTASPAAEIVGPVSPTNAAPFQLSIDFGELVGGFSGDDLMVDNGSVATFAENGDGKFSALIDADSDGSVTVEVLVGTATDSAGNVNQVPAFFTTVVDSESPNPVLTGPDTPTSDDPFDVMIDFGEVVQGLHLTDIEIENGTAVAVRNDGDGRFTSTVTAASDGPVILRIPADVTADAAGNSNTASNTFTVTSDTLAPSPEISGPAGPTNDDPFVVTIDFHEGVEGLEVADIAVDNGSVAELIDEGDGRYTAIVDAESDGPVTLEVPVGVVSDAAGNLNLALTGYSLTVDTEGPDPDISGPDGPVNTERFDISIDFGEPVNGFTVTDLVVVNGAVTTFAEGANGQFEATIDAISDGSVAVHVSAESAFDLAGNPNSPAAAFSLNVDTVSPPPRVKRTGQPDSR